MEYKTRENPLFSACGLNCGLCPGCAGEGFLAKHPYAAYYPAVSARVSSIAFCAMNWMLFPLEDHQSPQVVAENLRTNNPM